MTLAVLLIAGAFIALAIVAVIEGAVRADRGAYRTSQGRRLPARPPRSPAYFIDEIESDGRTS